MAPPSNGTAVLNPAKGEIGDTFGVVIDGWVTDHPPIEYNVYLTLDVNGDLRGKKLNDMPIYEEEMF